MFVLLFCVRAICSVCVVLIGYDGLAVFCLFVFVLFGCVCDVS